MGHHVLRAHDHIAGYQGLEERLWALVAQAWTVLCATALILEATLDPAIVRAAPEPRDLQAVTTAVSVHPS